MGTLVDRIEDVTMTRRERLAVELLLCAVRDRRDTKDAQLLADIAFNGEEHPAAFIWFGEVPGRHTNLARVVKFIVDADGNLTYNRPVTRLVRARIALFLRAWLRSSKEPDEWGDLDLGGWREVCTKCGWHTGQPQPAKPCDVDEAGLVKTRRIWPLWESAPAHRVAGATSATTKT